MHRTILKKNLSSWGLSVDTAGDAAAGLQAIEERCAKKDPYELVMLDMFVSRADGLSLARRIREGDRARARWRWSS